MKIEFLASTSPLTGDWDPLVPSPVITFSKLPWVTHCELASVQDIFQCVWAAMRVRCIIVSTHVKRVWFPGPHHSQDIHSNPKCGHSKKQGFKGDFSIFFSVTDRTSRQKNQEGYSKHYQLEFMHVTKLSPNNYKYTFSSTYGMFTKINYLLSHQTNLSKCM